MPKSPVIRKAEANVLDFAVRISGDDARRVTLTVVPCDYTRHGTPKVQVLVRGQRRIAGGPGYVRRVLRTFYGPTAYDANGVDRLVSRATAYADACRQYIESKSEAGHA